MTNTERANQNKQRANTADVNRPAMRAREPGYDTPSRSPNAFDTTNHEISNIFNNEQMTRYNERIREATERVMREEQLRANQSPQIDIQATDDIIPVKSVPLRSYTQTTQLTKDEIDRLRISTTTVNKTKNIREIHVDLQATGLLTLTKNSASDNREEFIWI